MKITYEQIKQELRNSTLTPGTLSEYRMWLAAEYAFLSDELAEILKQKPDIWSDFRKLDYIKSDKQADRLWESNDLGKREIELRLKLKAIEKLLSSIRTRLEIMGMEAINQV